MISCVVTLLSAEPEIQFVALRNINLDCAEKVSKGEKSFREGGKKVKVMVWRNPGIDPGTSRMLSERSTK